MLGGHISTWLAFERGTYDSEATQTWWWRHCGMTAGMGVTNEEMGVSPSQRSPSKSPLMHSHTKDLLLSTSKPSLQHCLPPPGPIDQPFATVHARTHILRLWQPVKAVSIQFEAGLALFDKFRF